MQELVHTTPSPTSASTIFRGRISQGGRCSSLKDEGLHRPNCTDSSAGYVSAGTYGNNCCIFNEAWGNRVTASWHQFPHGKFTIFPVPCHAWIRGRLEPLRNDEERLRARPRNGNNCCIFNETEGGGINGSPLSRVHPAALRTSWARFSPGNG